MTVVNPTYRPKSVRNRCVIEVFDGVFMLSLVFLFSVGKGVFVKGLSQISFLFSGIVASTIKCNFFTLTLIQDSSNSLEPTYNMWI